MAAEDAVETVPLSEPLMDLSKIGKTIDGSNFTFLQLDCVGKHIGSIKILEQYQHLRQIDLSKNGIKDVAPLKGLPHILKLNLSVNLIATIAPLVAGEEGILSHLLSLDVSANDLTALPPLPLPALKYANFAKNHIGTCSDFQGHEKLEELDVSGNQIADLTGLGNMPALRKLNLSCNQLTSIEGLTVVSALTDMDLSKNQMETLDGPWQEMRTVEVLNVVENQLTTPKSFDALRQLPKLRYLHVTPNPLCDSSEVNIRLEMLICHWKLGTIDGKDVAVSEREQAKQLCCQRLEEESQRADDEAAAAAGIPAEDS